MNDSQACFIKRQFVTATPTSRVPAADNIVGVHCDRTCSASSVIGDSPDCLYSKTAKYNLWEENPIMTPAVGVTPAVRYDPEDPGALVDGHTDYSIAYIKEFAEIETITSEA